MCIALGGSIELADNFDVEAFHELFPDLRSQTVAEGYANAMLRVGGLGWLSEKVAANLSNVLRGLFTHTSLHYLFDIVSSYEVNCL